MPRKRVYDRIAALYDRARPGYPSALFDDISAYAELRPDSRIVEVGCGTGQATLPMAKRGYQIDAIEMGANLAALARDNLAACPTVNVIVGNFESLSLPSSYYDLLMSATAFHWIDPAIRFQLAYDMLRPSGSIALFWHRPAQTRLSRNFVESIRPIYERAAPELVASVQNPPHPDDVSTAFTTHIPNSGLFEDLIIRKHAVATMYSAQEYVNLLATFSDHQTLPAAKQHALFTEISALINQRFGGNIIRETVALLYLARAISPA